MTNQPMIDGIEESILDQILDRFDNSEDALFEYVQLAGGTAIYPEAGRTTVQSLAYVGLGLAGEAGEVANKLKKIIRDDNGVMSEVKKKEISKELGDVMWYVAMLILELELDERQLLRGNLEKLYGRKERGVLGGSGDNR